MKYRDLPLTEENFNDIVSGVCEFYKSWAISYKCVDEISDYKPCLIVTSIAIPYGKNFQRNYLSIGFYKTLEEIKKIDALKRCKDIYFIPLLNRNENDIIVDINKKNKIF